MNNSYEAVGLTEKEYKKIIECLGREPNELELNMYGVMWAEHCSYKNFGPCSGTFHYCGENVLQGPEKMGIIDIGGNLLL